VAWIYCNYQERTEQTPRNLLASLLKQLTHQQPELSDQVKKTYQVHKDRESHPTIGEIARLLQSEMKRFSKVFIVVDALDEMEDDHVENRTLTRRLHSLPDNAFIMVTTRPIPAILAEFSPATVAQISATDEDVKNYVASRISKEHLLKKHVSADPTLAEDITTKLVKNVQGM
jgi:hypothetical protein